MCKVQECKYNIRDSCSLNVKCSHDIVEEQCLPTDNWYIVGSFVLDRVFNKNTANDIDLVMPEGEMPAKLPDEIVKSGLPIEMIWRIPGDRRVFSFHNISLPRIGPSSCLNWEVAEALKNSKMISTLPGVRKVSALTIFVSVKSMVKYELYLDRKTLKIWARSVLAPLGWKEPFRWLTWQGWVKEINWDYLRAEYLIDWVERVYKKSGQSERRRYLEKLWETSKEMELGEDIGYHFLLKYLSASIEGNIKEVEKINRAIHACRLQVAKNLNITQEG